MSTAATVFAQGTHSARPAAGAGNASYFYFETDTGVLFQSNGSVWVAIGFANPMSAQDDLILGGASGAPGLLAKGSDGQVLTVDSATHHVAWKAAGASGGMATDALWAAAGDLPVGSGDNAATILSIGTAGQILASFGGTLAYKGGRILIAETILGSDAASISFTSIPITAAYRHLELEIVGRGTKAAATVQVKMTFNADGGSNYDVEHLYSLGGANAAGDTADGQAYLDIGWLAAATATANYAGVISCKIFDYARTVFNKSIHSLTTWKTSTTGSTFSQAHIAGWWRNTAAIESITLAPDANNFLAGTVASLYAETV